MSLTAVWGTLVGVWVLTSLVGGAALALLAKRIHPGLSWHRLWIVYSALLGFMVAVVMLIALG